METLSTVSSHAGAAALFQKFDDANAAIKAFNHLLNTALREGDSLAIQEWGIHHLLHTQVDTLETICQGLRDTYAVDHKFQRAQDADAPSNGVRSIVPAGFNMVLVTEPDGSSYMTTPALAGVDPEGAIKARVEIPDAASDRLRNVDVAKVASASKTKPDIVQRVIDQLLASDELAESPDDQAATG